jgi:methylamine dehydrogenase heavy chain
MKLAETGFRSSCAAMALLAAAFAGGPAFAQEVESESSDVMKLEPPKAEWVFVDGGFTVDGTAIFDTTTGKMKGLVSTSHLSDLAFDPAGKYYYVSETIWSKGNRGTRQDMVTVYDTVDLKLQTEIAIPDRILVGERKQNFIVSDDGKWGFVYNLSPASSVNVVDLVKRKFLKTIELPGCAALMPNSAVGFSALCSDGSLATVTVSAAKPTIIHSTPFFSATEDPIFENFAYDKAKQETVMMSYTGLIYTAKMGATPTISQPWSLQTAAGYATAGQTKPLEVAWYPGGRQPMALHRASGTLYVLMHMGEYWSHKAPGSEIWVVDLAAKKVTRRLVLEEHAGHIEVTQGKEPKIFLNDEMGNGIVLDPETGKEDHKIERAGGGVIHVAGPA